MHILSESRIAHPGDLHRIGDFASQNFRHPLQLKAPKGLICVRETNMTPEFCVTTPSRCLTVLAPVGRYRRKTGTATNSRLWNWLAVPGLPTADTPPVARPIFILPDQAFPAPSPPPPPWDYNQANGVLRAVRPSAYPHAMTDFLHSVHEGRLLHLTLNRPGKRNALDTTLCRALLDALEDAARDPAVGAILLTASGRAFCAGMDLAEIEEGSHAEEIDALHERLFTIGARLTKPLIAGVDGPALGGGTGLVANCHVVVAGPEASFGLTEIRLGLWPFLVYRAVASALGERRTLELSLTGRICLAAEAREFGLVHEVCDGAPDRKSVV